MERQLSLAFLLWEPSSSSIAIIRVKGFFTFDLICRFQIRHSTMGFYLPHVVLCHYKEEIYQQNWEKFSISSKSGIMSGLPDLTSQQVDPATQSVLAKANSSMPVVIRWKDSSQCPNWKQYSNKKRLQSLHPLIDMFINIVFLVLSVLLWYSHSLHS